MLFRIAFSEHRVAGDQNFRARTYNIANRLQRYPAIDFDPVVESSCLADASEIRNLMKCDPGINFCPPNPGFTDITST